MAGDGDPPPSMRSAAPGLDVDAPPRRGAGGGGGGSGFVRLGGSSGPGLAGLGGGLAGLSLGGRTRGGGAMDGGERPPSPPPSPSCLHPSAGRTLTTHLFAEAQKHVHRLEEGVHFSSEGASSGDSLMDLVTLLSAITFSVKTVGAMVRCLGLPRSAGAKNVREANEAANETWIKSLTASRACSLLVSEECEEPISVSEPGTGQYAVVFDPLTGLAEPPTQDMGAIFGIFRQLTAAGEEPSLMDVLQPARQLVAAGYAVYGSSTMLVLTTGHGVDGFTLDPSLQEFVLTHPRLQVPYAGETYSINEGYASSFDERTKLMLETLKEEPTLDGAPRTCRYLGSMVPDVHRTLLYGGVFIYPAHAGRPMGRLKLLYEAGPLAFVTEQAGGEASTGRKPILDIQPESVHHRVPIILGSEDDVSLCASHFRTAPWGSGPKSDPMAILRRTHSIDACLRRSSSGARSVGSFGGRSPTRGVTLDEDIDGFVCAHLPVV